MANGIRKEHSKSVRFARRNHRVRDRNKVPKVGLAGTVESLAGRIQPERRRPKRKTGKEFALI